MSKTIIFAVIIIGLVISSILIFSPKFNKEKLSNKKPTFNMEIEKEELKKYSKNGIIVSLPSAWVAKEYDVTETFLDASGYHPEFYIYKPNLSEDESAPDAPTKNMAFLNFRSKSSMESLNEIVSSYLRDNMYLINGKEVFVVSKKINNINMAYIYTIEDVEKLSEFPALVFFKSDLEEYIKVELDFVNYEAGTEYSDNTIGEINLLLSTIIINK